MRTFRSIIILFTVALLNAFSSGEIYGQSWNMVQNDTMFIDACSAGGGTIYDNGGPDENYSNNFSGWVVINAYPGVTIHLQGNYELEGCCDYLEVRDGTMSTGSQLWRNCGSGTLDIAATSGKMTLQFTSDGSVNPSGFALNWSIEGTSGNCTSNISNLSISNVTSTSATLSWTADINSLKLDYGQGERTVSGSSTTLSGLNPNTLYTARLYTDGELVNPCCVASVAFRTNCSSMAAPVAELFDDLTAGEMPPCWQKVVNFDSPSMEPQVSTSAAKSGTKSLAMSSGPNATEGHFALTMGPEMSTSLGLLEAHVSLRSNMAGAQLEVGVCSSTGNLYNYYGFTPIDTLTMSNTGTWYDFTVPLTSYTGDGTRLAFRMIQSMQPGSGCYIYIDNLMVEDCGVDSLRVFNRSHDGLTLSWSLIGDPTTVDLTVLGAGVNTTYSGVISPYSITGLEGGTTYTLMLTPHCGSNYGAPKRVAGTTLGNDTLTLQYCQDFESGWPSGWFRPEINSSHPQQVNDGGNCMRMYYYYGSNSTAVLPRLTVEPSEVMLMFRMHPQTSGSGVVVGVMDYPGEMSSFIPVDTLVNSGTGWQWFTADMSSYNGTGRYIALRTYSPTSSNQYIYVDDIRVGRCLLTGLGVTSASATSVTLAWDSTSYDLTDSVIIEYGASGFTLGSGTRVAVLTTTVAGNGRMSHTVTGLTAGTDYQFAVYRRCADEVCSPLRVERTTHLRDYTVPYCEDFEDYSNGSYIPDWTRVSMYDNCPRINNPQSNAISGTNVLRLATVGPINNGYQHSTATLPHLSYSGDINNLVLSFYAYTNRNGNAWLEVGVMTDRDNESTFTKIKTIELEYESWRHYAVSLGDESETPLSSHPMDGYLTIRFTHDCGWCNYSAYIEDLAVTTAAINTTRIYSVRSDGGIVEWSTLGDVGTVDLLLISDDDTTTIANVSSPYLISGLQPGTTYRYELDYGQCLPVSGSFTTLADAVQGDWCYNFEDMNDGGWPSSWTRPEMYSNSPRVRNYTAHSGSKSLYFYSYNCNTPYHARAVLPYLEESDLSGLTLSFWAYGNGSQTHLAVGFTDDPDSDESFDTLAVFPIDHWGTWREYTVNMGSYSGTGRHLVFRWATANGCNSGELFIDDLRISRGDIASWSYEASATGADIQWTTSGDVDSVQIVLALQGETVKDTIFLAILGSCHLDALTPGTTYDLSLIARSDLSHKSCATQSHSLTTLLQDVGNGWCESFDASWPSGWLRSHRSASQPQCTNNSGRRVLEMRSGYDGWSSFSTVVLPYASQNPQHLILSFDAWSSHSGVSDVMRLVVGVMSDRNDTTTFVPLDTLHISYTPSHYSVDLGAAGVSPAYNGRYLALRTHCLNGYDNSVYLSSMYLSECTPHNIRTFEVRPTALRLSWQRMGYTGSSVVRYRSSQETAWTEATVSDTTVEIEDLQPSESYTFRLAALCQDTALGCQWSEVTCLLPTASYSVPQCFTLDDNNSAENLPWGWTRPLGAYHPRSTTTNYRGGRGLEFRAYNCNSVHDNPSMIVSPYIESTLTDAFLDCYVYNPNGSAYFVFGVMSDPYDTSTFIGHDTVRYLSAWTHLSLSLAGYNGHYLAIKYDVAPCYDVYGYVDNISIASCPMPEVWLTGQQDTSLLVNFTGNHPVWIEYAFGDEFTPGSGERVLATSSPHHIDGLVPASTYTFHVWPECEGATSTEPSHECNYQRLTQTTMHPATDIPYCHNFEGFGDWGYPDEWSRWNPDGTTCAVTSWYGHDDSRSLHIISTTTLTTTAILPKINVSTGCYDSVFVNFWLRRHDRTPVFLIGTVADYGDTSSFTPYDTIEATNEWQHHTSAIPASALVTGRIAIRLLQEGDAVIDNICVETCVATEVAVSDLTQHTATITWDGHGVDTLICEYGLQGFAQGTGTVLHLTSSPYTITDLSSSSDYNFIFRTVCSCPQQSGVIYPFGGGTGGSIGWRWWIDTNSHSGIRGGGGGISIGTTTQAEMLSTPYCEDFDTLPAKVTPSGWRTLRGSTAGFPQTVRTVAFSGARSFDFYTTTGYSNHAALRPVADASQLVLSFYAYCSNEEISNRNNGAFTVGVMTDPDRGDSFVAVDTVAFSSGRWQQCSVDLSIYSGTGKYIAFRFTPKNSSYHLYIDNLSLFPASESNPCFPPPAPLTQMTIPYCENFDAVEGIYPDGWSVKNRYNDSYTTVYDGFMQFSMVPNTPDLFLLPPLADGDSLGGLTISYDFHANDNTTWNSSYSYIDFGYLTDTTNNNSFVTLVTSHTESVNHHFVHTLPNCSANRLAIRARSTYGWHVYDIDNLVISRTPTPASTDLSSLDLGYATKHLIWDASPLSTRYQYEWGPAGFSQGTGTVALSDSCSLTLTGLQPETDYDIYFIDADGHYSCSPYRFVTTTPKTIPYCEQFDTYGNCNSCRPTGWNWTGGSNDRLYCTSSYDYSLMFNPNYYNSDYIYAVMPELDTIEVNRLSMYLRYQYRDSEGLAEVGVMTSPTDWDSFEAIDTLPCNLNNWTTHIVDFSQYTSQGRFLALRFHGNQYQYKYLYIDRIDIQDTPIPTYTVTSSHSLLATISADIPSPDYYIEICAPEIPQGEGRVIHVTSHQLAIDSLESNTTYRLYSRNTAVGSTCFYSSVTTSILKPLPLCENFDTYGSGSSCRPTGWTWSWRSDDNLYCTSSYDYSLMFYSYYYNTSYIYAVMPDVDVQDLSNVGMNIRYQYRDYEGLAEVGIMSSPTDWNSFVPIDTLPCMLNNWTTRTIDFSQYTGTGRYVALRFRGNQYQYNYLYVDYVHMQACPIPKITLAGYNTVKCAVDTSHHNVDYWVKMLSSEVDTLFHVTTNPYYITGLEQNSAYTFSCQCDSATESCFPSTTLTTGIQKSLPYCENFNTYGSGGSCYPTAWSKNIGCNSDEIYTTSSNNYSLRLYSYYYNTCYPTAILPDLDIDSLRHLSLQMRFRVESTSATVDVGVIGSPNSPTSFTPIKTFTNLTTYMWYTENIDFSDYTGDDRYIAIRLHGNNYQYNYLYIDYLYVQPMNLPQYFLEEPTTISIVSQDSLWLRCSGNGLDTLLHVIDTVRLTGLAEDATYNFYYRTDSHTENCFSPTAIQTTHNQTLPWCENFETATCCSNWSAPTGWIRINEGEWPYPKLYNSNTIHLDFHQNKRQIFVTPYIETDNISGIYMTGRYRTDNTSDRMVIGVMSNPYDTTTFNPVDTIVMSSTSWEWQESSFAAYDGPEAHYIAFKYLTTQGSSIFYVDDLRIETCPLPKSTTVGLIRNNVVQVKNQTGQAGFYVEYGPTNFTPGTGTVEYVDVVPYDIVLDYNTTYDFYFGCDASVTTCLQKQSVSTLGEPQDLPWCIGFEGMPTGSKPAGWPTLYPASDYGRWVDVQSNPVHSGSRSLRLVSYNGYTNTVCLPESTADSLNDITMSFYVRYDNYHNGTLTVGAMSSPSDASTFIPVQVIPTTANWVRHIVDFSGVPSDHHFIAFRTESPDNVVYIDDIHLAQCGAHGLLIASIESESVTLTWHQTGEPSIFLDIIPANGDSWSINVDSVPFTVTGLNRLTNYKVIIHSSCEEESTSGTYCNTNYTDSVSFFTPAGGTGCIDPTNLTDGYVTCFTGTYNNPYAQVNLVDSGYASADSRHTVHHDPNERDSRTGNLLRTVPEGAQASVRLGNWSKNMSAPEAEAVTYALVVDTMAFDLLVMRYAAVLQDPMHATADQPRFRLELLDSAMNLIDPDCGAADFIANQALGWNTAEDNVLWKDWTTVGLDMSAYAGQTVYIRLTTYDCNEGSHYGYAYFTLDCMRKSMTAEGCGNIASNTFTAPSGFDYRWYTNQDASTYSTGQSISVESNNDITYYCNLSFVDNPACQFTMSAFAGTRFPLSLFDSVVTIHDCLFDVSFNNRSTITMDGITAVGSGEGVEAALWDFGNGIVSDSYHAATTYTEPGTYTVRLIASLAGGVCQDTIEKEITLLFPPTYPRIEGPIDRCIDATPDTLLLREATSWTSWITDTLLVSPQADTVYSLTAIDSNGCTHSLEHSISVHPVYNDTINLAICQGDSYPFGTDSLSTSGTYQRMFSTDPFGCDSMVTVILTVNANTSSDTVADECDRYTWYSTEYTTSIDTATHHTLNAAGCDSTVTLHLTIRNSTTSTILEEVLENELPFEFNGVAFGDDTSAALIHLTNSVGCDSTIDFSLTVHWNDRTNVDSTICADLLPLVWNGITFTAAGTKPATLTNAIGADSIVSMTLHVNPIYNDTIAYSICANESVTFEDSVYGGQDAGIHPHLLQSAAGCDSLRVLNLEVRALTVGDTTADECDRFSWYGNEYSASSDTSTHHTTNVAGCDSTVTLHLTIRNSTTSTIHEEALENDLPHIFNNVSFENDTLGAVIIIPNSVGCDSVITYSLTVHWNERTYVDSTVCDDELPLEWNGVTFTAAGTQAATLHNSIGADSIVSMTLYVNHTYNDTIPHSICADESLTFEGTDYLGTDAGLHPHLLVSSKGCDSLRVLDLEVRTLTVGDTTADECDRFTWYGTEYTVSGDTSTHHTLNAAGCDSTVTLHLTIRNSTTSTVHEEVFENDLPYVFNGVPFSNDTLGAILHLTNTVGCDSAITFSLTVFWNDRTNVDSTICADLLPLVWNGVTFTTAGTKPVTLQNALGADSVVSMTLYVNPIYNDTIPHSICADESLSFEGTDYFGTDAGYHPHLLQTAVGCDSLRVLDLEVRALTVGDTIADECDNFTWYGETFSASTETPTHHTLNTALCDSTITLHLTIRYSTDTAITETIVENQLPYTFNGTTFTENSDLSVITIPNAVGCDSTIDYTLNVHWNTSSTLDSNLCFNQLPFTWNGATFDTTEANTVITHIVVIPSSSGSDSTITMHLHVRPVYNDTLPYSICDDEQYSFENDTYFGTDAGLHTYSLHTATYGCDSLRVLDLEVRATSIGDTIANECDSFTWYGETFTASTDTSTHHTLNAANCDSTITLHLAIRYSTTSTFYDTIVENQLPYTYHDSTFSDSISHVTVVFPNAVQCDSVVDYSLTVHWNVDTTLYDTICHNALPLAWNGVSFDTTAMSQSFTLARTTVITAHTGADSTITMHLTVHPNYDHHTQAEICDNQSYTFGDSIFLGTDGTTEHLDSLLSIHGCDSLSMLHLTVHPTFNIHTYDTICSNQSVTFADETYDSTGIYPHSLLSVHGCDSLATLNLQVWPAYDNHIYDTICDDTSRFFIDSAYRQSGDYAYQFASEHGCDSLETLHLKVWPTYDIHLYDTIYDGDRYTFEGSVYDTTGIYPTLLQATFGCDSLRTLHLQRNRRTYNDSTLCQNNLPLVWNGVTFSEGEGSRTGHLQTFADSVHLSGLNGIDSLVVMRVTAVDTSFTIEQIHACDSITWRDNIIYSSSTSTPFLRFENQWGCDSIRHLDLTVDYTHRATDQHQACDSMQWIDQRWYFSDTIGPLDTLVTTGGCDSIVTLNLAVHYTTYEESIDTFCFGTTYSWRHFTIGETDPSTTIDSYLTDTLRTIHHCDSVLAIRLTQMAKPMLVLDTTIDCGMMQYTLSLTTDMPYWRWWAEPEDPAIEGIENMAELLVAPETVTDYHVTVDYRQSSFCPLSDHVTLRPIEVPKAELKINPNALTLSDMELDAYDISYEFESRNWYINWQHQTEQSRHLHYYATTDLDSVIVALSVYNGTCLDTALRIIPILKTSIFAPNAFTPSQESNNRFIIVARGLIRADLYIYNREGLLVYHTTNIEQGWDGRSENGTPCKQGNYVWKLVYRAIDLPSSDRTEIGSVLLIR